MKFMHIIKRSQAFVALLLILLFILNGLGQIRRAEIASFVHPTSSVGRSYFGGRSFRLGGGVVPRGKAEFIGQSTKEKIPASQLKLTVLEKGKLQNVLPDYDAIGIRWKDEDYPIMIQDDLILPLMKFIKRDEMYIAYTIPGDEFDEKDPSDKAFFNDNDWLRVQVLGEDAFVAKDFSTHSEFLYGVDVLTKAERLPPEYVALRSEIAKGAVSGNSQFDRYGTYVNADFNVRYQVFLDNINGKRVAEVAGLPLRYHWSVANDKTAIINKIEIFQFPENGLDLQYRSILFFQAAGILRQFKESNKPEFDRFMEEISTIMANKPT